MHMLHTFAIMGGSIRHFELSCQRWRPHRGADALQNERPSKEGPAAEAFALGALGLGS